MDFQKLTSFMEEYLAHYRELLVFENGKLRMISDDDIEGLNKSLSREQALIMKTNALESKRFTLQSGGNERKSFRELISEAPEGYRNKLSDQYRELSDLIFSIKRINDDAHEIVRRRLGVMEEAKKGLRETYDRSGGKLRSIADGEALDKGI